MNSKEVELNKIKEEVTNLTDSPLCMERIANGTYPVIGEGSSEAQVMFIGEAPGRNEAESGRPFCGRTGQILDELLESIGIRREDVYITNIVKDRPPRNRDPKPEEIEAHAPFLDRQIEIIEPKAIATLGRFSMQYIMTRYGLESELAPISELHGQTFELPSLPVCKLVPLYHPAAAIYNQKLKPVLLKDFKVLKTLI